MNFFCFFLLLFCLMLCYKQLLQPEDAVDYQLHQQQQEQYQLESKKLKNLAISCQYGIKTFSKNYQPIKEIENQSSSAAAATTSATMAMPPASRQAKKSIHRTITGQQKVKLKNNNNKKFYKLLRTGNRTLRHDYICFFL